MQTGSVAAARGIPSGAVDGHDGQVTEKPDLTRPRAVVLAAIAGSALSQSGSPRVRADGPLRALPPAAEARHAARNLSAPGGRPTPDLGKVFATCALLAVLDAVVVVIAIVTGHVVFAIVAGVLFLLLAAFALAARSATHRDPAQVRPLDRRAIGAASRWDSKQSWTGPLATSSERGLVVAATQAAERIARSPGWTSNALADQRIQLDLIFELDQIDDQAHRIAVARQQQPGTTDPVLDQAWDASVDRVAALTAYADNLDGLAKAQQDAVDRLGGDPVRDTGLLTGATQDQQAFEQLYALSLFLNGNGSG
jgi:hypothetical protein